MNCDRKTIKKNLEEIQDQIAILSKREKKSKKEMKVLKRNKSPNRKGKLQVQIEKRNKSPNKN